MDQHEITREIPLLNADGELTEPGYAKKLLPVYRRADIKASPKTENTTVNKRRLLSKMAAVDFPFGTAFPS